MMANAHDIGCGAFDSGEWSQTLPGKDWHKDVKAGEKLGLAGNSGNATNPHIQCQKTSTWGVQGPSRGRLVGQNRIDVFVRGQDDHLGQLWRS